MTKTAITQLEARLQVEFFRAGHTQARCQVCRYDGVFLDVHHVIAKGKLKKLFPLGAYLDPEDVWRPIEKHTVLEDDVEQRTRLGIRWDPRNALLVCKDPAPKRCHDRHTLAVVRIPRSALRPENFEFALELGIEWILDAEYPGQERAAA